MGFGRARRKNARCTETSRAHTLGWSHHLSCAELSASGCDSSKNCQRVTTAARRGLRIPALPSPAAGGVNAVFSLPPSAGASHPHILTGARLVQGPGRFSDSLTIAQRRKRGKHEAKRQQVNVWHTWLPCRTWQDPFPTEPVPHPF